MEIKLKTFQDDFIFSKKKFPCFAAGWATGKSMSGIMRAMVYSEHIPGNMGIIFRKEFTDLRDSTCKDFGRYTGLNINSSREVVLPNKSVIMFRHIEELHNIQNVNLGWFFIEQADELESDNEFFLLFGRLRRQVKPDEYFKSLGLCERSGWIICNAGDHWVKPVFKEGSLGDSELIEASTMDNIDVLPEDFIKSLDEIKKNKPAIYNQFVQNDWNATRDNFIVIQRKEIEALNEVYNPGKYEGKRKIIAIDPSMGGDECVFHYMRNHEILDSQVIIGERDTMKIAGMAVVFGEKYDCPDYAIDAIGIGAGICDRLCEMKKTVHRIVSSEKATQPEQYYNLRTEMWFYTQKLILDKMVVKPKDEKLIKQLCGVRFKVVNSNGLVQLEPKELTKKRLGESPDRADPYIYGNWALQFVKQTDIRDMYTYKRSKSVPAWRCA